MIFKLKFMNNIKFFLLTFIMVTLSACKWFSKEEKPKLVIINVLDKMLYNDCHIKGSINVPFEEFEQYSKTLDKDTHVVVYCSNYMCTASGAAAKMLKNLGFQHVWAYEAGMAEWYQKGYPVEPKDVCKEKYLTMQISKPENEESDIQVITTDELKDKIKNMLSPSIFS